MPDRTETSPERDQAALVVGASALMLAGSNLLDNAGVIDQSFWLTVGLLVACLSLWAIRTTVVSLRNVATPASSELSLEYPTVSDGNPSNAPEDNHEIY